MAKKPKRPVPVDKEAAVTKLRETINSLKRNIVIYENDMARCIQSLRDKYGIESIEEGVKAVEDLDRELSEKEAELGEIINKISVAMEQYSG